MLILKIGMKVAQHFCHMLRRQTSFNHLFQATRLALNDPQVNSLLLHDWQHQDLVTVTKQALHVARSLATSTSSSSSTSSAAVFVRKRRQPDPTTLNSATVEVLTGCKFHFLIKKIIDGSMSLTGAMLLRQCAASLSGCCKSKRRWRLTPSGLNPSWIGGCCSRPNVTGFRSGNQSASFC